MSYNGSGTFTINSTGQPVVAGTVITASAFNALTADLATGLTTAITKDGQTTTTAQIPFAQGLRSTLVTDSSSVSTGSIITDGGVGIAKNLYVGGTLNVTGSTSLTNPVINNIKMGYTTTATAGGSTSLTVSSNYRQFFTGTLAQTIVLPVTSTLVTGMAYEIENNSTGLLTVNSSGGNLVGTIPAGVCAHAVCIGTTLTTAADWDWDYISTTTITGTGANVLGTSPTITSPTLVTPVLGTPASGTLTNCTGLPTSALTGSISEANGGTGTTTGYYGFKNRIINGAMVISQRGASFTPANGDYTLDRWQYQISQSGKLTVATSSDAPSGFKNSMLVTSSSAYSVGAGDYFSVLQSIEGFNTADLMFGSATASTVSLSFWVKSTLTGTFGGTLINGSYSRAYPFTYTINSASTWEYKTITIAGDQSGTWVGATNGTGLQVNFGLGVGANNSATAGSWTGAGKYSATGAVSVVGTNGATFYITGVQLEKGSTATSFDYRPYGTELALCQRYCQVYSYDGGEADIATGVIYTTTTSILVKQMPVTMRAGPTLTSAGLANLRVYGAAASSAVSSISLDRSGKTTVTFNATTSALTAGQGNWLRVDGSGTSLTLSAEL